MILIVDFGSQTCHLIARRIREFGVETDIVTPEEALLAVNKNKPKGIIFSGGPTSVYENNAPTIDKKIFSLKIPILGICYGQQLTAYLLAGGQTVKGKIREDGPATLIIDKPCLLFEGVSSHSRIWMSHGDTVVKPPKGFSFLGHSETIQSAAMSNDKEKIYGVQFHPEVEHTEHGKLILRNFIEKICKIKTSKRKINIQQIIKTIQETVGDKPVIAAVSGGVDSTVSAVLVGKAIGKKLTVVYVDNGLMRLGTKEQVEKIFKKRLKIDLRIIECKELFLRQLKGVIDPEQKRKTIGKLYIDLFEKEARTIKGVSYLVQGTIYSDVIESGVPNRMVGDKGTKHADKIKSHHNVGGLPENMELKLLEPLREFYKDEVREIGRRLKLPKSIFNKQPFPGPGQAIRIVGEITEERLDKQQRADQIVMEEIKKAKFYDKVFQSFPIMTGVKSTAVKGDGRFYGEVVALRVYDSKDIMSASWSRLSYDLLQKIVSRITNEVPGISRVVYDITTKPPATMEWE